MSEGAGTTLGAAAIVIIVTVICHLGPKGFVRDQTKVWSVTAFVCFADDKSRTIQGPLFRLGIYEQKITDNCIEVDTSE